jgi:predicted lipid-binding transport protein (Tim44 family)
VVRPIRYTTGMAAVVGILLAVLVVAVVVDTVARMERPGRERRAAEATTQKVIVDLTKRR